MSVIVAIGERARVEGFALAGLRVVPAEDAEAARAAWQGLGPDVGVVLLTARARASVSDLLTSRPEIIWTEIPS